ncbi:VanW family protein [Streptomyces nojiriensis]|uniref:VanW family protein n=1 Tax=Streptomyces nojiriensis TaxID=66374 RepID=UPI00365ABBE4
MRRASPTGTGTPAEPGRRWTASGIAGAAAGAAVVGFGRLYAAGLLLAGEEVAAGTKVRGVSIGGMTRDEARQTLDLALGPAAAAPVALRIGERTEQADPAALGLSLDSAATADRAARTGSGPPTVIGRLFASGDPDLAPGVRLDEKAARGALDGIGEKTGVRAREGSVAFAKGKAEAVAPVTGIAVDVDGALDALRADYPRTPDPDPGADAGTEPLTLPVRLTEPRVGRAETDRAPKEFAEPAVSAPVTLAVAGRKVSLSPAVLSRHLGMKDDGRGRLAPALDAGALLADPSLAGPLRQAAPGPAEARLRLDGAGRVTVAEEGKAGRQVTERALSAAVLPLLTGTGAAARTGEVATESVAPRLTEDTVERLGIKEKVSSYIERYPEGREATVAWGSPDLRFANDSGKALYIQAEATDTAVTITFLGTRKYEEIRAHQGPRTNVKQPATRTGSGPKCEPQSPLEGFDVAVDRVFVQGGKEVGRETMKTRYTPRDHVTCGA